MLKIRNLVSSYGVIKALKGISMEVNEGELVTLVGANGAGKSTLLKSIIAQVRIESGDIAFMGNSLLGKPSHKIVKQGIAIVPEGRRIFADLTVVENLEIGAFSGGNQKRFKELSKTVYELFPRLEERKRQFGGTLSGGEQQMLAVGRAIMAAPKLLLLDEPSMGLAPVIVEEVFNIIRRIKEMGTTILLVEQNAMMALKVCDRAYIIKTGLIVGEDSAENILGNKVLLEAYLGGENKQT
ncbi:MAG: ABC transporter ATP-binding protein [Lutisporaceae bacterium]|jgi:branched-chain amino acid transport system ATP-binding protein